jgi:MinD-like ATPase involved in chromosome partitioning or flagellar assembly
LITVIYSPKGGVGNTLLTLALAREAANKLKVCAVEFDFTPGDFPSLLDVDRRKNVYTAMRSGIEYALQRPEGEKFDVIPGGYADIPERFEGSDVNNLFSMLSEVYDLTFVDVQPAFCPAVVDALSSADKVLLVTVDDCSVVSRTIGTLDWAATNNFVDIDKFMQVVNLHRGRGLKFVNLTGPQIPLVYTIPHIRQLNSYRDIRLKKHARFILHSLMPDVFEKPGTGLKAWIRRWGDGTNSDGTLAADKQNQNS